MTVAETVGPHLPYLRRFSRALSGSQKSGDSYVEALLEAIVVDPSAVSTSTNPRVSLYALLCGLWESISLNLAGAEPRRPVGKGGAGQACQHRAAVAPGVPADRARGLHPRRGRADPRTRRGRRDRAPRRGGPRDRREMATDVLIIEDEPIIAADIEALVTRARPPRHRHRRAPGARRSTPSPASARAWSWPTSSWPTAPRASTRSRTSSQRSTCR